MAEVEGVGVGWARQLRGGGALDAVVRHDLDRLTLGRGQVSAVDFVACRFKQVQLPWRYPGKAKELGKVCAGQGPRSGLQWTLTCQLVSCPPGPLSEDRHSALGLTPSHG